MKLADHFRTFLDGTVNINATRLTQLEDSADALKRVLRDSDWKPKIRDFVGQGSWAHKTIIKPVEGKAFDADVIVLVDPVDGWDAKSYLSTLRALFASHGAYKDKVRRYSHCVTIEYAGERKIDLAPCVVGRVGAGSREVCNFNANLFEASEPEKYTDWLVVRNGWTGGNCLRKVTRLHKFLRDIKGTFTCPSVLLTTLLGERITILDEASDSDFVDVPTALRTITRRLDDWLQDRPIKPTVLNPVLPSEAFSGLWDDDTYANFREKIHTYRSWIDEAYDEPNRDESIGKWRRVFGDDFAADVALDKASGVTDEARKLVSTSMAVVLGVGDDLVELFRRFGRRVLPPEFDRLPHKRRPQWRLAAHGRFAVVLTASRHSTKDGLKLGDARSGEGPLPKRQWLLFEARSSTGVNLSKEYDVEWRVTNTDQEATREKCLRGDFYPSSSAHTRWEELKFRGVHTVEAFAIQKRDKMLVAQSDPFYVVIE